MGSRHKGDKQRLLVAMRTELVLASRPVQLLIKVRDIILDAGKNGLPVLSLGLYLPHTTGPDQCAHSMKAGFAGIEALRAQLKALCSGADQQEAAEAATSAYSCYEGVDADNGRELSGIYTHTVSDDPLTPLTPCARPMTRQPTDRSGGRSASICAREDTPQCWLPRWPWCVKHPVRRRAPTQARTPAQLLSSSGAAGLTSPSLAAALRLGPAGAVALSEAACRHAAVASAATAGGCKMAHQPPAAP